MNRVLYVFAAALLATPGFTIVHAASAPEPLSVRVSFADLDTSTSGGALTLFTRLKAASKSVCRNFEDSRQQDVIVTHAACVEKALENAIADVNLPRLTAFSATHGVQVGRGVNTLLRRD